MKSERKIKRAYKEGYQDGYQQGIITALNNFVGISMAVLKRDYGWTDEQIEEFSTKLMGKPKEKEENPDQLSMFEEEPKESE